MFSLLGSSMTSSSHIIFGCSSVRGQYFELLQEAIVNFFPLQVQLIHLFYCILNIRVGFLAQVHGSECAFAESLLEQVRVNHLFASEVYGSGFTKIGRKRHFRNTTTERSFG